MHGDHSSTFGWTNIDPIRAARAGTLRQRWHCATHNENGAPRKRREPGSRRKPKAGFLRLPPSLGNLAKDARFPLSQRADDGYCSQIKDQGGSSRLNPKPDSSRVNKTGHLDLLATGVVSRIVVSRIVLFSCLVSA